MYTYYVCYDCWEANFIRKYPCKLIIIWGKTTLLMLIIVEQ